MGVRTVSQRHDDGGENALFYLIITLQYVELIACIIEIAGSIYLAVRGPGDSVAVIASIAMLFASSTSLCVLVVHQLAAKSLQGQNLREYRRRQHSLRGIMGSFLTLLLIAWTTTGVLSVVEATRSTGCHDSDDARRYWRGMTNCVVQKATLAISLLMIVVTLALLAAIFTLGNAFAASLSGFHRRNHTEEELHLSNHPTYANVTVTPYREKRIKAPLLNDTTPNFDPVYPNDSPTSIETSSPTPRPLNLTTTTPSRGPSDGVKNAHSRQRSWLPPLKFHENTVTLHPALQSTSAVNLLPSSMKPSEPTSTTAQQATPAAASMPDLPTPSRKSHASKTPFRSAGLARTKTAATMASSVYSRHTNTTVSNTAQSDNDDRTNSLFSRQPSLSSLSEYSTIKTPPGKSFIRHPATTNPFAPRPPPPKAPNPLSQTTTTNTNTEEPKNKPRPLPIIGPTNPFLDSSPGTAADNHGTIAAASAQHSSSNHKHTLSHDDPPLRPGSSPSMPPSSFWMYARSVQRKANHAQAQDGAFPVFHPSPGRRRSNTAPSFTTPSPSPGRRGHGAALAAVLPALQPAPSSLIRTTHPAFRSCSSTTAPLRRRNSSSSSSQHRSRSGYERVRKSPTHGVGHVPLARRVGEMGVGVGLGVGLGGKEGLGVGLRSKEGGGNGGNGIGKTGNGNGNGKVGGRSGSGMLRKKKKIGGQWGR